MIYKHLLIAIAVSPYTAGEVTRLADSKLTTIHTCGFATLLLWMSLDYESSYTAMHLAQLQMIRLLELMTMQILSDDCYEACERNVR
jgi:hypothetical protein